jgi:RHS repeat-associated protein
MASTLGVQNPLHYRGYVYDQETGLYYLQSRYYDPEIGRFLNADALIFLFAITGGKYDFHTSSKKINVYTTHKWVDIVFLAVQLVSYELG